MAWLQVDFFSRTLIRSVPLQVLIPAERLEGPFPTLYLLNGYMGDSVEWLLHSDLQALSKRFGICIVTSSGENSFYTDHPVSGMRYSEFAGSELPEFTRSFLPLSCLREDTLIAGESMGGYGALHVGIKHPDTFGHVIALSPGMIFDLAKTATDGDGNIMDLRRSLLSSMFGNLDTAAETELNPPVAARNAEKKTDLFISCGTGDSLYAIFDRLCLDIESAGYPITRDEAPGGHEWSFWCKALERGLEHALGRPHDIPADILKEEVEKNGANKGSR